MSSDSNPANYQQSRYLFWRQLKAMLWKNYLFTIRRWSLSLLQLIAPIIFVSVLLAIDTLPKSAMENPYNPLPRQLSQPVEQIGKVPRCLSWGEPCVTLSYAPSDDATAETIANVEPLMKLIMEETGFNHNDVSRYSTQSELVHHVKQYPNTTNNAVIFRNISSAFYGYTIMFNASSDLLTLIVPSRRPDGRNELHIAVDNAIIKFHNETYATKKLQGYPISISYNSRRFPQLGYKGGQSAMEENGAAFYYCGIMFQFVVLLYNICHEKDLKLRQGLKMIGLLDSVYWISWMISGMVFVLLATLVLIGFGFALNIDFFVKTDFFVTFMMFFLFGLATCALAMFCSVFIGKSKGSLNAGILFFVLGLLLVGIVSGNAKGVLYDYYNVYDFVPELLSVAFPMFNLGAAMAEIKERLKLKERFNWTTLTHTRYINHTLTNSSGFVEIVQIPIPNASDSFWRLFMNFCVFIVVAAYLDQVLPSPNGEPKHVLFFLDPAFWGFSSSSDTSKPLDKDENRSINSGASLKHLFEESDAEVFFEKRKLLSQLEGNRDKSILQVMGVVKKFIVKKIGKKEIMNAVDDVWFTGEINEVFVLLGHNGAGKSTLINVLTGLSRCSSGDAAIDGFSVNDQMDLIRSKLGVCPQHDNLYDELSAREHLMLVAEVKGTPVTELKAMVERLLSDVMLLKSADKCVGTFSGGMKRRLSVAMSFMGNPKIVFLDEPTSGMDPLVRRDIWNLILRMRKERCIMMTTHSMEEADALGDKIAVMSAGKLKTTGSSIMLKSKWSGYCLTACLRKEKKQDFFEILQVYVNATMDEKGDKMVHLDGEEFVYSKFHIAPNSDSGIILFLDALKDLNNNNWLKEVNFSQSSLEDVFMKVTADSGHND